MKEVKSARQPSRVKSQKSAPVKPRKASHGRGSRPRQVLHTGAPDQAWWQNGVRFQCQGSGQCCMSRGEYGFVFLSPEDRRRLASFMGISTGAFTKKYCDRSREGIWHLKEVAGRDDCMFLKDGKSCGVYAARPGQCRTWPFWPEVMSAKAWSREVASFCPGVGKGPTVSATEILTQMQSQISTEKGYGK